MAQKYRHIAPANPDGLVCNHNLFYLRAAELDKNEAIAFSAVLNSTLTALLKHFYGRYAGTEGTLKTEVVDTLLLEIPDPRGVAPELAERFDKALKKMMLRNVTHLVEEALLQCHSEEAMRVILLNEPKLPLELRQADRRELDDCVFELIGVTNQHERQKMVDELHRVTAEYYRYQRTQDIQAMENRAGNNGRRFDADDLAGSIWQTLSDNQKGLGVTEWIKSAYPGGKQPISLKASRRLSEQAICLIPRAWFSKATRKYTTSLMPIQSKPPWRRRWPELGFEAPLKFQSRPQTVGTASTRCEIELSALRNSSRTLPPPAQAHSRFGKKQQPSSCTGTSTDGTRESAKMDKSFPPKRIARVPAAS